MATRCDEMKERLSLYVDRRLSGNELASVEEHLLRCPACREEVRGLEEVKALLKAKERVSVPADLDFSFLRRFGRIAGAGPFAWVHPALRARALVGAVVVAVLVVGLRPFLSMPLPVISGPKGTVKIYLAKRNEWRMVEKRTKVGRGDIVKTFQNSQADIEMPGVCNMRLKANSEIRLARLGSRIRASETRYSLQKGKVLVFHRQARSAKNEFKVETPEALNTALGTDFAVSVLPEANRTWVGVLDGKVMVNSLSMPLEAVTVDAGQKTEVYAGRPPLSPSSLADNEWNEIQELYQIGAKPQVALLISSGENRVRELLRPCPLYVSDRRDSPIPAILRETVGIFNKAIQEKSKVRHLEALGKFEEIVVSFPDKKYNVQFLLFIGAYYDYLGEYEEAIDTFEKVINGYPGSRLVSLAQCAAGVIYEEKIHNIRKAKTSYQKILVSYPNSPEAAFAISSLNRLSGQ